MHRWSLTQKEFDALPEIIDGSLASRLLPPIDGPYSGSFDGNKLTVRKNPHAVALGRKGGKASKGKTSKAKVAAARKNGKKGGRPRKKRA